MRLPNITRRSLNHFLNYFNRILYNPTHNIHVPVIPYRSARKR